MNINILLHPTYFPNVAHFTAIVHADQLTFEVCDNYQKQTYRNRCDIYAANGKLSLTVPVSYTQKKRQPYKDVKIANDSNWQTLHLKSLQSAYRMSPFYEFYEDELMPLFEISSKYMLDFNFKCFDVLLECLQLDVNYNSTAKFVKNPENTTDYRALVDIKSSKDLSFDKYTQVFDTKYGFLNNLSILDVLFNEGPNTLNYLETQQLTL